MKPREAFSILATALLIGTVIAQDQLFECPRGKEMYPYFVVLQCGSLTKSHVDTLFSSFYLIPYRVTSNHFILHFLVMKENMRVVVCQKMSL